MELVEKWETEEKITEGNKNTLNTYWTVFKCNEISLSHITLECDPMVLSYIHGT